MEEQEAVDWINQKKREIRDLQTKLAASKAEIATIDNQLGFNTAFIQEYHLKLNKVYRLNMQLEQNMRTRASSVEYLTTQLQFSRGAGLRFQPQNPDVFLQAVLECRASTIWVLKSITQLRQLLGYPFNPGFEFRVRPFSQQLISEEWLTQGSCIDLMKMFGLELTDLDIQEIYERHFFEQSAAAHLLLDDRIRFVRQFWIHALKYYAVYMQGTIFEMPMYTYEEFQSMLEYEQKTEKSVRDFSSTCRTFHTEPMKVPFSQGFSICEFRRQLPDANYSFLRQAQEIADEQTSRTQAVQGQTISSLRVFKPEAELRANIRKLSSTWPQGLDQDTEHLYGDEQQACYEHNEASYCYAKPRESNKIQRKQPTNTLDNVRETCVENGKSDGRPAESKISMNAPAEILPQQIVRALCESHGNTQQFMATQSLSQEDMNSSLERLDSLESKIVSTQLKSQIIQNSSGREDNM